MKKLISLLLLFTLAVPSFAYLRMRDFRDPRDKEVYRTVQIGDQRWMAENLRFKLKGTYCYDNKDYNCDRYGRLYTWAASVRLVEFFNTRRVGDRNKGVHDVCPTGWHLPTNRDFMKMRSFVTRKGKAGSAGTSLKTSEGWNREYRLPFGNDEFGFHAIAAGERDYEGVYMGMGEGAQFWSASEFDAYGASLWQLRYDSGDFDRVVEGKELGASVRCVEDKLYKIKEPAPPPPKVVAKEVKIQGRTVQTVHIGDQVWMANNYDVKVPGSYCYNDNEANCVKYGRLYTWPAVMKLSEKFMTTVARDSVSKVRPKGVCPNGWHVPTVRDYNRLEEYLKEIDGGVGVGVNLRSRSGWDESDNSLPGENGFGFNAEALGAYKYSSPKMNCTKIMNLVENDSAGVDTVYTDSCVVDMKWKSELVYEGVGQLTGFWTGTETDSLSAVVRKLSYDDDKFILDSAKKLEAYYVRCIMDPPDEDEFYDSTSIFDRRDQARYKTVAVGEDVWMAENLRYAAPGSFCYQNNDDRCRSYGRLYTWTVAMNLPQDYIDNSSAGGIQPEHQGVCPDGWHVPTNEEWTALGENALVLQKGGIGSALKNKEGWASGSAGITAASGFNALPSGNRYGEDYSELGSSTYFWAAAGGDGMGGAYWYLVNNKDDFLNAEDFDNASFSLRCIKNKSSKAANGMPSSLTPLTPAAP